MKGGEYRLSWCWPFWWRKASTKIMIWNNSKDDTCLEVRPPSIDARPGRAGVEETTEATGLITLAKIADYAAVVPVVDAVHGFSAAAFAPAIRPKMKALATPVPLPW